MLIIVNENANSGNGAERWAKLAPELSSRIGEHAVAKTDSAEDGRRAVDRAIADGHDAVVAAGGDGTVNSVLNALMDPETDRPRGDAVLGAIGLGSSNDFHKPFDAVDKIGEIPVRLSVADAPRVDVGKAVVTTVGGEQKTRYFILNGSVGFFAIGNAFFNTDDRALVWLKRRSVDAAILYAIVVNIIKHQPIDLEYRLDGGAWSRDSLVNLSILKKVQFAGDMRYDTGVRADDGMFDVNVWLQMSRLGIVRMFAALFQGKFSGRAGTRTLRATRVDLRAASPFHLELDGEVDEVVSAELSVLPQVLRVCR